MGNSSVDKRSIVLIVIAAGIILGGQILSDVGKGKMRKADRYVGPPPQEARIEFAKGEKMYNLSKYSLPVGAILGSAGALWLIVSAIQGSKKKD